jgi:hypothetical protein
MALQSFVGPWLLFQFLDLYTVGRPPWTGDQPVVRPLPMHMITQTQNKRKQTSMSQVEFEPTISVFEWANTIQALDRAATVICMKVYGGVKVQLHHSWLRHYMEVSSRLHVLVALPQGIEPPISKKNNETLSMPPDRDSKRVLQEHKSEALLSETYYSVIIV